MRCLLICVVRDMKVWEDVSVIFFVIVLRWVSFDMFEMVCSSLLIDLVMLVNVDCVVWVLV